MWAVPPDVCSGEGVVQIIVAAIGKEADGPKMNTGPADLCYHQEWARPPLIVTKSLGTPRGPVGS